MTDDLPLSLRGSFSFCLVCTKGAVAVGRASNGRCRHLVIILLRLFDLTYDSDWDPG